MGRYRPRTARPLLRCRHCDRTLIAPLLFDGALLAALCPDCSATTEADNSLPVFSLAA
jgi:hypothetical protein